jgi:hypothetical protein
LNRAAAPLLWAAQVVDIHQNWCGPCSIMEPIYRKAYIELDRPDERLKFYTIEVEKLTEKGRAGLPVSEACKPLFVVYKVRGGRGARAPPRGALGLGGPLASFPSLWPPSHFLPRSSPLFSRLLQNGKAITKVLGAVAPELETAVFDNVPDAPKDSEE